MTVACIVVLRPLTTSWTSGVLCSGMLANWRCKDAWCALVFLCHIQDSAHHGTDTIAALCLCSLLSSLRRLTLGRVKVSLPALQPIATRLHELNIHGSRLQGSAEGFLTKGWTALTSLALTNTRMEDATLSAALELPAVEGVDICWFEGHQGGELQIDQLIGSCPQISRLEFQLLWSQRLRQASRQSCTLVDFKRLVNLNIMSCSVQTNMDLDLPLSLTQLQFGGYMGGGTGSVDFFWALQRGCEVRQARGAAAQADLPPHRGVPAACAVGRQPGGSAQAPGMPAQRPAGAAGHGRPERAAQRIGRSRKRSALSNPP